jgi:CelD/BcsL family acetyltransferase involved in cellulose biosynthesis
MSCLQEATGQLSRPSIEMRLITTMEEFSQSKGAWDEAVLRLGGSVYMTFDWVRTWWEFYGGGKELRIFLFLSADRVVAAVPVYIDKIGFGPFRLNVARLVGSNIPPKVFNPPVALESKVEIWTRIFDAIFDNGGCDIASLGPISDKHQSIEGLSGNQLVSVKGCWRTEISPVGVHTTFFIPGDIETYFNSLGKNERKKRKYEVRSLQKEFQTRIDVVSDHARVDQEFADFAEQHRIQWNLEGKPGHFGSWPLGLEFNRALVKRQAERDRVRFVRIMSGDKVLANQFVFEFGDSFCWELPSRIVGPEWDKMSLGPCGLIAVIETGIARGIKRIEGGLGHYEYKLKMGAQEENVKLLRATSNSGLSAIRRSMFAFLKTLLRFGYHKILYRRLSPIFPRLLSGPQWSIWLRMDY